MIILIWCSFLTTQCRGWLAMLVTFGNRRESMPRVYAQKFKDEYADDIYSIIANGGSIRKISAKYDISTSTAWAWLTKNMSKYKLAMEARTSIRVEDMFECFDELRSGTLDVAVFREMKDVIKWTSGKESSTIYADQNKALGEAVANYATYLETLPKK